MQFDLRKFITAGTRPYHAEFQCDLSAYDYAGARIPQPVTAVFDAQTDGDEVQITLRAKASVHGECARCLDPVTREETVDTEWIVKERDLDDPDFDLPLDEKGHLDVDEWLNQEFMFQIPTVLLCSPDCAGLCPQCGKKKAECTCPPADNPIMQSFSVIYLHMIMPGQGSRSRSPLFLKRRRTATRSG